MNLTMNRKIISYYFRVKLEEKIPGKVVLKKGTCEISNGRKKYSLSTFEVLINTKNFLWETSNENKIHSDAVLCGRTYKGENLYVGRTVHDSKVNYSLYRILVENSSFSGCRWKSSFS